MCYLRLGTFKHVPPTMWAFLHMLFMCSFSDREGWTMPTVLSACCCCSAFDAEASSVKADQACSRHLWHGMMHMP